MTFAISVLVLQNFNNMLIFSMQNLMDIYWTNEKILFFLKKMYISSYQKCTYRSHYIDLTEIYVSRDDFQFRYRFPK